MVDSKEGKLLRYDQQPGRREGTQKITRLRRLKLSPDVTTMTVIFYPTIQLQKLSSISEKDFTFISLTQDLLL